MILIVIMLRIFLISELLSIFIYNISYCTNIVYLYYLIHYCKTISHIYIL